MGHAERKDLIHKGAAEGPDYYNTLSERGREQAEQARLITEQLPITIVPADADMTLDAARLKGTHTVEYADCFAAALAIRKKAKVVTGDPEFKKFGDKVPVSWII